MPAPQETLQVLAASLRGTLERAQTVFETLRARAVELGDEGSLAYVLVLGAQIDCVRGDVQSATRQQVITRDIIDTLPTSRNYASFGYLLPGVNTLVDQGSVSTYYDGEPYMLAAASANLIPNQTRAPMDDVDFRQALARSIDVDKIVSNAYGGLVSKAHPSGLVALQLCYISKHDPET